MLHSNAIEYDKSSFTYFAGANGFSGFRNYFDSVFSPKKMTRLYILKGGPGTGKNTLMRTIANHFDNCGLTIENILCSSDPKSLDGIIIKTKKNEIGILDGTAPHVKEASFPGLCETLVDLGRNLTREILVKHKKELFYYAEEKKKSYQKGYDYLNLCGIIDRNIMAEYENDCSYSESFQKGKAYGYSLDKANDERRTILLSAFCKLGYKILPINSTKTQNHILINGNIYSKRVFMKGVYCALEERKNGFVKCVSPYCENEIEAILVPSSSLLVSSIHTENDNNTKVIELDQIHSSTIEVNVKTKTEIENQIKTRASNEFANAAKYHFQMEDIYSMAMDFEENQKLTDLLIKEITIILDENSTTLS